jgi:hypothetical protein
LRHYAIVSGSETSCEAWNLVRARLREFGHTCCVHSLEQLSWTHGVEAAIQVLADRIGRDEETILVGHSIAGLFLPSVGEKVGATSEVYIAAIIPQPRKSVFDQILMGEELFSRSWTEGYEAMRRSDNPRVSQRSFLEWHLFHDCPPHSFERYWIKTELPLRTIYQNVYPAPHTMMRSHFIVCTGDRTLQPRAQQLGSELLCSASVAEIDTGHCPHVAAPAELADLIRSLTGNVHP